MRYCSRCKTRVPLSEWTLRRDGNAWEHTGTMRGIVSNPDGDDEACGFVELIWGVASA